MNNKAIEFLMEYGFKLMTNVKGEKKTVYIELPSEDIDKEINKIILGTETEVDYWLSGKYPVLVNDEFIIYIKEAF